MDKQNSSQTKHLTLLQAFVAMTHFLEYFYQRTKSDDIGSLLSGLSFLSDGNTADPAAWHDWLDAVNSAHDLTVHEAYHAMVHFLDVYRINTNSTEVALLLHDMEMLSDGTTRAERYSLLWNQCTDDTLNGKNKPMMLTFVEGPCAKYVLEFQLTPQQSFNALFYFLQYFYEHTRSSAIQSLLTTMQEKKIILHLM